MGKHEIQTSDTLNTLPDTGDRETPIAAQRLEKSTIWTPAFLVLFAVTLIVGLSLASILTQGWLNGYYPGESVFLGYLLILAGLWLSLLLRRNTLRLRAAAVFGLIWVFATAFPLALNLFQLNAAAVSSHLTSASAIALTGSYLCLSLNERPYSRWERWFLWLAPLILLISLPVAFLLGIQSVSGLEGILSGVALGLSVATWWLRPFCWRTQPLPTFLFGLVPLIQLLFNLPHRGETNFFYTQLLFLAFILGLLYSRQKEQRWARSESSATKNTQR